MYLGRHTPGTSELEPTFLFHYLVPHSHKLRSQDRNMFYFYNKEDHFPHSPLRVAHSTVSKREVWCLLPGHEGLRDLLVTTVGCAAASSSPRARLLGSSWLPLLCSAQCSFLARHPSVLKNIKDLFLLASRGASACVWVGAAPSARMKKS